MKILVTGAAGFIGYHLVQSLLKDDHDVIGLDNFNSYYDINLKRARINNIHNNKFSMFEVDLVDNERINSLFKKNDFDVVVNLAAQAGVRYSLTNPDKYIESNIIGFTNILEACRHNKISNLVYASSSSVYGMNSEVPFDEDHSVDHPVSLYAATKRSNELMAHTYSHLFNLPTIGLRFFTVYGPWDRPDMALQKFAHAIMNKETIKVFNYGNHRRDFTYIDDIVEGVIRVLDQPAVSNPIWASENPDPSSSLAPWKVYNIGNNNPVNLMDYISALEASLEREADKEFLPIQPGDVPDTYADVSNLVSDFDYKPATSVKEGIANFSNWFRNYYY